MRTLTFNINVPEIKPWQRRYSSLFRSAYRLLETGHNTIVASGLLKSRCSNSWLKHLAVKDAEGQLKAHQTQQTTKQRTKKVIWGGRDNFRLRAKRLISKQEWCDLRLRPMFLIGEENQKSNRFFNFDLENQRVIFKPNGATKIVIDFIGRSNWIKEITQLQQRIGKTPITIRLTTKNIQFIFEEKQTNNYKGIKNRVLAIDSNPHNIGVWTKIKQWSYHIKSHKEIKELNPKISQKSEQDKRKHEIIQIAHDIIKRAKSMHVGVIAVEKLKINKIHANKNLNRTTRMDWKKTLLVNKLKHLCVINGIEFKELPAAYSSFVGNLLFDMPDPISAAAELGRRARIPFGQDVIFPVGTVGDRALRWKDVAQSHMSYREVYALGKKRGLTYPRRQWGEFSFDRFRFCSVKSLVDILCLC